MPRKPRIHYPGATYHVMLRGNAGQDIFFDAGDRSRFYFLLQQGVERFGVRLHAYCLMSNHLHLAVQVGEVPLHRCMQNLSFRYTQYLNRKRNQSGHVFQGRYKALLVDADSYLLELVRYIHMNPLRASLVEKLEDWPWSSHRAYLGQYSVPWLTTSWVLGQLSSAPERSVAAYRAFLADGHSEEHRKDFHRGSFEGRALGDDSFIDEALSRAGEVSRRKVTLDSILDAVVDAYGLQVENLKSRSRNRTLTIARATVALLVRETEGLSLTSLSRQLGHDLSGLSQAARRLEVRMKNDHALAARYRSILVELCKCQA